MSLPGPWVDRAACAGLPVAMFFPVPGDKRTIERALRICNRCPVVTECAEFYRDEQFGIFGGMTPRQRNRKARHCGDWVPALGSSRRLRALAGLGYGPGHIFKELAVMGVTSLTRHGVAWIRDHAIQTEAEKVEAIAELYDRLVERGPNTANRAVVPRKQAYREGWALPHEWAGVDIDDPNALPHPRALAA